MSLGLRNIAQKITTLVSVVGLTWSTSVFAQASETRIPSDGSNGGGMDTHLFRPAVDSKGFFHVNGTDIIGHNDISFGLFLDWGHTLMRLRDPDRPVGEEDPGTPGEFPGTDGDGLCEDPDECVPAGSGAGTKALIAESFTGTLTASYGIANLAVVGLSMPVVIMIGDDVFGLRGSASNDAFYNTQQHDPQKVSTLIPHAKFRILRVQRGFGLSVVVQAGFPIAKAQRDLAADPGFWFWPRVVAETRVAQERLKFGFDLGFRGFTGNGSSFGTDVTGQSILREGALNYGNKLTYGVGISWRAAKQLDLVIENYGTYLLSSGTDPKQALSSEFLGGAKLFIERNSYLMVAGGSRAFFTGYEAADARAVLGFVYEPSIGDRDGDGIKDDVDQCPDNPEDFDNYEDSDGCPELDNDNDGILDKEDRCPNVPEDMDGNQDRDGCPESESPGDRDGDGILDKDDECPDDPEDKDGFEDEDGCPDKDNDRDGILDVEDACPDLPEDKDGFEDEDGCPDDDNDFDRILDKDDQCPLEPEVYNGFEDGDGCPDKGKVIIDGSDIVILEKIQFATGSDVILPESREIVDAVAATLKGHPEFEVIEVAGHADERGSDEFNLNLTQRRAASVRRALNERGIANSRIVSQGYGEYCPLDEGSNPKAWDVNRRVDFKVVKTEDGMTGVKRGCVRARNAGLFPPPVR